MQSQTQPSHIHPSAVIDKKATLGVGVEIGPYSVVGAGVVIEDRCVLGSHVVVQGPTTVGAETVIHPFASVGGAPQDLKFRGEASSLVIGKRNQIRENVTLQRGTSHGSMTTIIGDNNLFMVGSHVAHDCIVGNNNVIANHVSLAGHVRIGNNTILGGMVGVHQFCRIGDYAILGAGAMVGQDVPPYCIGQGDRCCLRGINIIGLKRAEFKESDISDIKRAYRTLFLGPGRFQNRLEQFPEDLAKRPAVQLFLSFITNSERGVCLPERGQIHVDL